MNNWIEDFCPNCDVSNFFSLGDLDDPSGMDVEGGICWKCKHKWAFPTDFPEDKKNITYEEGTYMIRVNHKIID